MLYFTDSSGLVLGALKQLDHWLPLGFLRRLAGLWITGRLVLHSLHSDSGIRRIRSSRLPPSTRRGWKKSSLHKTLSQKSNEESWKWVINVLRRGSLQTIFFGVTLSLRISILDVWILDLTHSHQHQFLVCCGCFRKPPVPQWGLFKAFHSWWLLPLLPL